jgi:hypothetical protein
MRYFEIAKPTTDTISTATDTSNAEALTKRPKSVRPNGVETNYPIRATKWRTPPPGLREIVRQGCQKPDAERVKSREHADGSRSA